jgi:hypothetical protein
MKQFFYRMEIGPQDLQMSCVNYYHSLLMLRALNVAVLFTPAVHGPHLRIHDKGPSGDISSRS